MSDFELLPIRPFPQIEYRKRVSKDFWRALGARALNNEVGFSLLNRDFVRGLRTISPPPLSPAGERVAHDLTAHGIAFAQFAEFFDSAFYDGIDAAFARYLEEFNRGNPKRDKGKAVFLDTIHKAHTFVVDDPVSTYCATPAYAAIAACYMGMVPRFVGTSFWHTRPAPAAERLYSQQWHRDYNDRRLVKVFLYLTDVGAADGYFEYVTGSHARGPIGRRFDKIGADGYRAYPDSAAVDAVVAALPVVRLETVPVERLAGDRSPWSGQPSLIQCTASHGCLIFADTFGLHRGGHVTSSHRDVIMNTYSSNFNIHKPHFAVTREFAKRLTPFMKMAFGIA